jgi:hypothetical protein
MRLSGKFLIGAMATAAPAVVALSSPASALVVDIESDANTPVRAINSPPTPAPGDLTTATSVSVGSGWDDVVSTPAITDFTLSNPITLAVGSTIIVSFDIGGSPYTDTVTVKTDTVAGNTVELTAFGELMGSGAGPGKDTPSELDLGFTQSGGAGHTISGSATYSASTVPEPSTWAMVLLGFAGLGYAAFRRGAKTRVIGEAI